MKALNVNKLTRCGVTFKFWYTSRLDLHSPQHADVSDPPQCLQCAGWQTGLPSSTIRWAGI